MGTLASAISRGSQILHAHHGWSVVLPPGLFLQAERQTGRKLRRIRMDMGREWLNSLWDDSKTEPQNGLCAQSSILQGQCLPTPVYQRNTGRMLCKPPYMFETSFLHREHPMLFQWKGGLGNVKMYPTFARSVRRHTHTYHSTSGCPNLCRGLLKSH